jgi:hypothetical protein
VKLKLKESVVSKLKSLEARDQAERNEYLKNYLEPLGYEKGVAKWIKDKNRDPNDVFDDAKHYPEIKKLVGELIKSDKPLKEDVLDVANVLVIHMDKDRKFQHEFLDFLSKHHHMSGPFKSISDRLSCAESGTQKYGTQNGCEPDKKQRG